LQDGQVDGVFEGEESAVKSLVDYCRHGPLAARVENVGVKPEKYKAEFSTFEVF
jgi:acylphosphatase